MMYNNEYGARTKTGKLTTEGMMKCYKNKYNMPVFQKVINVLQQKLLQLITV